MLVVAKAGVVAMLATLAVAAVSFGVLVLWGNWILNNVVEF
jgi:hypothetical protein